MISHYLQDKIRCFNRHPESFMISCHSASNLPLPIHVTCTPVMLTTFTSLDMWWVFRLSAWNADQLLTHPLPCSCFLLQVASTFYALLLWPCCGISLESPHPFPPDSNVFHLLCEVAPSLILTSSPKPEPQFWPSRVHFSVYLYTLLG